LEDDYQRIRTGVGMRERSSLRRSYIMMRFSVVGRSSSPNGWLGFSVEKPDVGFSIFVRLAMIGFEGQDDDGVLGVLGGAKFGCSIWSHG
jgi:hypothetical protein